jgi:hypothetical protein
VVHLSALVRADRTLPSKSNSNEQLFINLATVMGRRISIIPPSQSCGRKLPYTVTNYKLITFTYLLIFFISSCKQSNADKNQVGKSYAIKETKRDSLQQALNDNVRFISNNLLNNKDLVLKNYLQKYQTDTCAIIAYKDSILKSAKQGWAGAQHNLAYSYASGRGIKQDVNQAFYWTLKCAEQNDPECANIIIGCYTGGTGTAKNLDSAAVWVLKIASVTHDSDDDVKPATGAMITTARKTLAMLYRDGEYYPKDKIKSYMWFLIYNETRDDVSDLEQKNAIDAIKELEKKLSAEDKRKAKEMAEKQL